MLTSKIFAAKNPQVWSFRRVIDHHFGWSGHHFPWPKRSPFSAQVLHRLAPGSVIAAHQNERPPIATAFFWEDDYIWLYMECRLGIKIEIFRLGLKKKYGYNWYNGMWWNFIEYDGISLGTYGISNPNQTVISRIFSAWLDYTRCRFFWLTIPRSISHNLRHRTSVRFPHVAWGNSSPLSGYDNKNDSHFMSFWVEPRGT
jgi:hypothetical protein